MTEHNMVGPPSPRDITEAYARGLLFVNGLLSDPPQNTENVVTDGSSLHVTQEAVLPANLSDVRNEVALHGLAAVAMDWGGSFVEADRGCPRPDVNHLSVIGDN